MADHATPNLPSPDFAATSRFYGDLGFSETWRDKGWMILTRGELLLEFFPYPDLDSYSNSFSCCLRLDDLDSFYAVCRAAGPPGWPKHDREFPAWCRRASKARGCASPIWSIRTGRWSG